MSGRSMFRYCSDEVSYVIAINNNDDHLTCCSFHYYFIYDYDQSFLMSLSDDPSYHDDDYVVAI